MSTTVNGWPVLDGSTDGSLPRLRKWIIPGTDRHFLLRDGAIGFVIVHMLLFIHEKVERLNVNAIWDEWGYALRPVRGQTSGYSNHAGGGAADFNATLHPLGVAIAATFTALQIRRIRWRLRFYRGLLIWGGDWSRPDGMHIEAAGPNSSKPKQLKDFEWFARKVLMRTKRGKAILKANPGAERVIRS